MCWWIPYLILGIPIAYFIRRKYAMEWWRAISFGMGITVVSWLTIGMFLSAVGIITIGPGPSISLNISRTSTPLVSTVTASYTQIATSTQPEKEPPIATMAAGFAAIATPTVDFEKKYQSFTCQIPSERFTSKQCFYLFKRSPVLGIKSLPGTGTIYFSGDEIAQIAVGCGDGTQQVVNDRCAQFLTDVAITAGWNLDDVSGAMVQVAKAKDREWITYNTINAVRQLESGFWFFYFEQKH